MRWPWSTRRQDKAEPVPENDDTTEAVEARRRAERSLLDAKRQTGEIRDVRDRSLHHQRVNHFAQLINETFRGGP